MKTQRILAAALAASLAWGAAAQASHKITAGKANEFGLAYTLPSTVLDLYIEAEITSEQPGDFHNYAGRYLGTDKAIHEPSRSARVKSVTIVPRGIATDADRQLAEFKPGSSAFINLTPDNLPLALNTDELYVAPVPQIPVARPAETSPLQGKAASEAVTADMARSSSLPKKAELAAQRIFEIRETRSDLLSGNADNPPADGAAMKLVLDNLAAQEAALTAMFQGVKTTATVVEKVSLEPDSASTTVVARLSAVDGIIDADNLAGAPITAEIELLEEGTLPVDEKGVEKSFPKGGVAYTVPGTARVTVYYAGNKVAQATLPVAQYGVVFGLDPKLFTDKNQPYKAIFDPSTGAVTTLAPIEK